MKKIDFADSTLLISARSPFARRVRLALIENGIRYHEKVFNVFEPSAELIAANPLARVPALELKTGEVLVESHIILESLYGSIDSFLTPESASERLIVLRWQGVASGLCEKIVEFYLESLRPVEKRDPELIAEIDAIIGRVLSAAETQLGSSETLVSRLSQADLDLGSALAYLSLRHSTSWREKHPSLARYLDRLEARPSFAKTRPPA